MAKSFVFRYEDILFSEHIKKLTINPENLPQGTFDTLTIDLGCAAILAGLAGYDTMTVENNVPAFSSDTATLEFVRPGPFELIDQKPGLSTHLLFNSRCTYIGTKLALGTLFYGQNTECIPMLHDHFHLMENLQRFKDLRNNRCRCEQMVDVSAEERQGLKLPLLALLSADAPETARVFPSKKAQVLETVETLA